MFFSLKYVLIDVFDDVNSDSEFPIFNYCEDLFNTKQTIIFRQQHKENVTMVDHVFQMMPMMHILISIFILLGLELIFLVNLVNQQITCLRNSHNSRFNQYSKQLQVLLQLLLMDHHLKD